MSIGQHLASLNLFREADGTVEITVSGSSALLHRIWATNNEPGQPIDYVERLIIEAAENIKARRQGT